ncbi:MAG TPA: LysM domain-containing protein, partial [Anaerolineae bacterium]|nr:LysM domain-containing protein [Anaerolineae bacterium]
MDTNENPLLETAPADNSRFLPRLVSKALAKGIAWAWPLQDDRRALASLLGRWSAHLGIAVLALALIVIGRVTLTPVSRATVPDPNVMSAVAEPLATPTRMLAAAGGPISRYVAAPSQVLIAREALPHTTVPERVRLEVITYTVQSGDTIFGIAADFGLSPYTIVWSNMETLQGAPWHIQPGLTLFIPPVDGAYHTVVEGETVEAIAEAYE